jgi:TIR domain
MVMPTASPKPIIFISYSHKDQKWLDFVQGHLQVAVTNDHFETWDDRRIEGGGDWAKEIDAALAKCAAFILLVSRHSLVSTFILKKDVSAALEAHWNRGVKIYPIIVRACDIHAVPWLAKNAHSTTRYKSACALFGSKAGRSHGRACPRDS